MIVPVGQFIGSFVMPDGERTEYRYAVRLGPDTIDLEEPEFGVWALARGVVSEERQPAVSVTALSSLARRADLGDAEPVISDLLRDGLLAEVDTTESSTRRFALGHRVLPLGIGLGNTPEDPIRFGIGELGSPRAYVSAPVYDVWAFGAVSPSLWETCERSAELEEGASTQSYAAAVVAALPVLLATDAAFVDLAIG